MSLDFYVVMHVRLLFLPMVVFMRVFATFSLPILLSVNNWVVSMFGHLNKLLETWITKSCLVLSFWNLWDALSEMQLLNHMLELFRFVFYFQETCGVQVCVHVSHECECTRGRVENMDT